MPQANATADGPTTIPGFGKKYLVTPCALELQIPTGLEWMWADTLEEAQELARNAAERHGCSLFIQRITKRDRESFVADYREAGLVQPQAPVKAIMMADLELLRNARLIAAGKDPAPPAAIKAARALLTAMEVLTQQLK